jgi:hypothetical protein
VHVVALSLTGLSTYPGGQNLAFSASTTSYNVATGFNYLYVGTTASINASTLINGASSSNTSIAVDATGSSVNVTVVSPDFGCAAHTYWINVVQGIRMCSLVVEVFWTGYVSLHVFIA